MGGRSYNQHCGVAQAAEIIGERWNLLIVRDLLIGPERYGELLAGLPGLSSNVLATRLRDLEEQAVVQRRLLPRPASGTVYELTDYGRDLEDIIERLAIWGSRRPNEPVKGQAGRPVVVSLRLRRLLRALVAPQDSSDPGRFESANITVVVDYGGDQISFLCSNGHCTTRWGASQNPDLLVTTSARDMARILSPRSIPERAQATTQLAITGEQSLAQRFRTLLTTQPVPTPS